MTRLQLKENQKQGVVTELHTGLTDRKRKAKTQSCEGLGMKCKMARLSTPMRDKDVLSIRAPISDKES